MRNDSRSNTKNSYDFDDVLRAELEEIVIRRDVAGIGHSQSDRDKTDRLNANLTGLALSGGGVRSAAFSLGVLQSLNRRGWLKWFDYLSTVSGGGFAGAYLSSSALTAMDPPSKEESSSKSLAAELKGKPKNREEERLKSVLGFERVQLPRIRQLLGSGGFLFNKILWLNRQLIGVILIWLVVFSGLVAVSSLMSFLFRQLDLLAVRQIVEGLGFRDDLSLALVPSVVLLLVYLFLWTLSYWKYSRLATGQMARFAMFGFLLVTCVAIAALIGNGEVDTNTISTWLIGEPLSMETRRKVEQWVPTLIYSFLGASLIPYLTPRRLFRSGDEGAGSLEQLTFGFASAALVYGIPFLLVAYFARENVSLYSTRRIPFMTCNYFLEQRPPKLFRNIWLERQLSEELPVHKRSESTAGYNIYRELVKLANSNQQPNVDDRQPSQFSAMFGMGTGTLAEIEAESKLAAHRHQLNGPANTVVIENAFADPHNEINWFRRFRHFIEYFTSYPATDKQDGYAYAEGLSHQRTLTRVLELQAHSINQLLVRPEFYTWFPASMTKPEAWRGTEAEWLVFREARDHAAAVSALAEEWLRIADQPWSPLRGHTLPGGNTDKVNGGRKKEKNPRKNIEDLNWLFDLTLTDHLQTGDEGQAKIYGKWAPQEESTRLEFRTFDLSNRKLPSGFETNWNEAVQSGLDQLDHDGAGRDVQRLLSQETNILKRVLAANRAVLESYYPNTLDPGSRVYSYVVLLEDQKTRWNWFVYSSIVFLLSGMLVDLNATSWHGYYSKQIASAWIEPAPGLGRDIPLSQLETTWHGLPYHLITGTLNQFQTGLLAPCQSALFLFSRQFCGAMQTGFKKTDNFEGGKFCLADAIAVSGAAFSPWRESNPLRQALLYLSNFRLGQWVQNPQFVPGRFRAWEKIASSWPITPFTALWTLFHPQSVPRYVFVTDGGHTDNLAIEPLLQRRARFIVAIDATEDPDFRFTELRRVITSTSNLMGIHYEWLPPPSELSLDSTTVESAAKATNHVVPSAHERLRNSGHPKAWWSVIPTIERDDSKKITLRPDADHHWLAARITYPESSTHPAQEGYLLYLKCNVCATDPPELVEYQRTHGPFPHHPTSDLIFDAERFEAYRRLGEAAGDATVKELWQIPPVREQLLAHGLEPIANRDAAPTEGASYPNDDGRGTTSTPDAPHPASPHSPGSQPPHEILNEWLQEILDPGDDPSDFKRWLRRKKSAAALAKYPESAEAIEARTFLEARLGYVTPKGISSQDIRCLLLEFGDKMHSALESALKHASPRQLPSVVDFVQLALLLRADDHLVELLAELLRKDLKGPIRRSIESAIKSLPYDNYSPELWEEIAMLFPGPTKEAEVGPT